MMKTCLKCKRVGGWLNEICGKCRSRSKEIEERKSPYKSGVGVNIVGIKYKSNKLLQKI